MLRVALPARCRLPTTALAPAAGIPRCAGAAAHALRLQPLGCLRSLSVTAPAPQSTAVRSSSTEVRPSGGAALGHPFRTALASDCPALVGQVVRLGGWVHSIRAHGGLTFVLLRDSFDIVQLTINNGTCGWMRMDAHSTPRRAPTRSMLWQGFHRICRDRSRVSAPPFTLLQPQQRRRCRKLSHRCGLRRSSASLGRYARARPVA